MLLASLCILLLSLHTATAAASPRARRIATPAAPTPTPAPALLPAYPPLNRLADNLRAIPYPNPPLPSAVYLYAQSDYSAADFFLLLTLQGALAKLNAATGGGGGALMFHVPNATDDGSSPEWVYWRQFQQLLGEGADRVDFVDSGVGNSVEAWLRLLGGGGRLTGYYLTALHTDSVNVGLSLAGVTPGAIAATAAHTALLRRLNVTLLEDVRNVTERDFVGRYVPAGATALPSDWPFSTRFLACEPAAKSATSLTDWSMLLGALTVHGTDTYQALLPLLHAAHSPPQFNVVFGWVTDDSAEHDFTGNASAVTRRLTQQSKDVNSSLCTALTDCLSLRRIGSGAPACSPAIG